MTCISRTMALALIALPMALATAADRAMVAGLAERGVFRHVSVEAAWRTAAAAKRPLVVMFTSANCPHCDRMLAETFAHPNVQQMLAFAAETALADAAAYRALAGKLGVRAYPTTIIVSGEGKIVDAVEGYLEPAKFAQRLTPWIDSTSPDWRAVGAR